MHAEQIYKFENIINEKFAEVGPFLVQTTSEIGHVTERIQSREMHLNTQYDDLLQTYRHKQNDLAAISEKYRFKFFLNF